MNGLQMMTTDSEQVLNGTVNGEKTLSLYYRLEPSPLAFFLTRWLMRGFSPVVLVLTGAMHNGRKELPMCCRITPQLACIGRTILQTPIPNCLVRNKDASFSKQILYVSKAQREPMV